MHNKIFLFLLVSSIFSQAILHFPIEESTEKTPILVEAFIDLPDYEIKSITLFYRLQGEIKYVETPMFKIDTEYLGEIPSSFSGMRGVEYFLIVDTYTMGFLALPNIDPTNNPFRININKKRQYLSDMTISDFDPTFTILSPEPNSEVIDKDVMIYEGKIEELIYACEDFIDEGSLDEAKRLIKYTLAIFFDKDIDQIDPEFLRTTELTEFWEIVLGDPDIARILVPDFFKNNFTFQKLIDTLEEQSNSSDEEILSLLLNNSVDMKNKLNGIYLEDENSMIRRIVNHDTGLTDVYYWVNTNHLTLFNAISL